MPHRGCNAKMKSKTRSGSYSRESLEATISVAKITACQAKSPGKSRLEKSGVHLKDVCMVCRSGARTALLLLHALDLVNLLHNLAKHDDTVAVQECNARKTLAVLPM